MVTAHLYAGGIVFALALAAIVWRPARRYVQYLLLVQILLGVALVVSGKHPLAWHWVLAILVGALWPLANALERRGRPAAVAMAICALAALVLVEVFRLGYASTALNAG